MNEILEEYKSSHSEVIYIAGTTKLTPGSIVTKNGVKYLAICKHSKNNRLIFKESLKIVKLFKSVYAPDIHIQFRVPSIFTLQLYILLIGVINKDNISFYIAGDWEQSLIYNYPNRNFIAKLLPFIQNCFIRNKKCVCTGEALAKKVEKYTKLTFEFYSTTHKEKDIKDDNKFNSRKICFIGRIEKLKNYKFFVNLSQSSYMKDNYTFHILGDGPETDVLLEYIKDFDNVFHYGHLSERTEVQRVVDGCKYFILPSYTEGTSKTLPEVMARSTIPIAFKNVGANNSIIYENGKLVDVDDINAVVEYITLMDRDLELYKRTKSLCIDYARSNSIDKQVRKMFEFIYG
uniref:Glycosyl transferase, group 1 family protein n=1 Tax=Vibrio parahaemolyticus TaxID=670 RepID=A0A5P4S6V1_VIBPH|nr:glycosyl transferase, group 1 family protein [Vibrio parahaemolyticus]